MDRSTQLVQGPCIILYWRKGELPPMEWRWRSCYAAPGGARGNGIRNTWLPASTLFQWRWAELRTSCGMDRVRPIYITNYLASGLSNGEWRRILRTCCQVPGPGANVIDQWGLGNVAMEPMERTTAPGKM